MPESPSSPDFVASQRDRTGSISPGRPSAESGGTQSPANGNGPPVASPTAAINTEVPSHVQEVLQSEIGISTMLNRLKQSIASAKEFANFLKKRSALEEENAAGLKKLCRASQDSMRRPEHKTGTFATAFDEMMAVHERMAENGAQFSISLLQMHDDLSELAAHAEKNRKLWKQTGLQAEQHVGDLEAAMRKSKSKYDSLAEHYDRLRTGDTSGQKGPKTFGFKGPKSAAQHEEDLLRKVQAADQDYHGKVLTYQSERGELLSKSRPEAVKALQDTVRECDSGLALQMQKLASFNEKLLLSNGLCVSPDKDRDPQARRSLREIVSSIDDKADFHNFVASYHSKLPPRTGEPKYERNPVLNVSNTVPVSQPVQPQSQFGAPAPTKQPQPSIQQPSSMGSRFGDSTQSPQGPPPLGQGYRPGSSGAVTSGMSGAQRTATGFQQHERSFSHGGLLNQQISQPLGGPQSQQQRELPFRTSAQGAAPSPRFNGSNGPQNGPPQLGALSFQSQEPSPPSQSNPIGQPPVSSSYPQVRSGPPTGGPQMAPTRPVFGVSLSRLYERDGLAVPMVVYQCIQAVDLYGLGVEGIYRLSGSLPHVNKLKAMFDTDSSSSNLDFRNPENFFHDVNSVAGLLKQFFRDLPDPLFTKENYSNFVEAAKNDDDIVRRDSLHALINNLPDPNYATLRALTLHLWRVIENSGVNRMNSQNLSIVFGPTLLGTSTNAHIADAGWQVRVVDTILQNTYQIFDDD